MKVDNDLNTRFKLVNTIGSSGHAKAINKNIWKEIENNQKQMSDPNARFEKQRKVILVHGR